MSDNHYDTLRVQPTATASEIRRAFRRVAAEWHPEKWAEREPALGDAMFRAAAEAYVALSGSRSRADRRQVDPGGLPPAEAQTVTAEEDPDPAEAISTSRASEIFVSEMTLFAKELFAEGMDPGGVESYLVSFGCPPGLSRQVVQTASLPSNGAPAIVRSTGKVPPWPTLEPVFVAFLTGRPEVQRMEDSSFARLIARHRVREMFFLGILVIIAAPAIGAAFVRLPDWLTLSIPIALCCAMLGWLVFSIGYARRHPGFRPERKLRLDLVAMREIAHRPRFSPSEFSLEAALGGPIWAAHHRMPGLAFGWMLAAAVLDVALLTTGHSALLAIPAWALASLLFGFTAARLRFRACLAALADCAAAGDAGDGAEMAVHACIARRGGTRTLQAMLAVLGVCALIALNFTLLERSRQVSAPAPSGVPAPVPQVPPVERTAAAIALDSEDEERASARVARQEAAQQFNELMAGFEKRHPEFDSASPRYNPAATESLARRIAILEGQGLPSPEALRQAMREYERLLSARPVRVPDPAQAKSAPAVPPSLPTAIDDDALRTLCETFPHACRR